MMLSGYKTVVFAALVAVTGFLASPEFTQWVAENLPGVSIGLSTAIVLLRAVTSSPIFTKPE